MARKGGISSKFYRETAGIKVSGGQIIKAGALLTRQGDKWKPGLNVVGRMSLTAVSAGEVYFTHKRNSHGLPMTVVNVRPVKVKAPKAKNTAKSAKAKKTATAKAAFVAKAKKV